MATIFRFTPHTAGTVDPQAFAQFTSAFVAAMRRFETVSLVVTRDAEGVIRQFAVTPGESYNSVVMNLAHAVKAKVERVEDMEGLHAPRVVGWLEAADTGDTPIFDSARNVDPGQLARMLPNVMPAESWMVLSLREASEAERRRNNAWMKFKMQQTSPRHASLAQKPVAFTLSGGAATRGEVQQMLDAVAAALPGFDVVVRARAERRAASLAGFVFLSLASLAVPLAGWLHGVSALMTGSEDLVVSAWAWASAVGFALSGIGVLLGVLHVVYLAPTTGTRIRRAALSCERHLLVRPPSRRRAPRPPQAAVMGRVNTEGVIEGAQDARPGEYPMHRRVFIHGPETIMGLLDPHVSSASKTSTRARSVPTELTQPVGPMVAVAEDGRPVYFSAKELWQGVAISGKAGSGKSVLVNHLWGWNVLERVSPSDRPGFPGTRNTLVAIESKFDGARDYAKFSRTYGDSVKIIDIANPGSPGRPSWAIDLLATPGTLMERSRELISAMKYAYGDEAIGPRSTEALAAVIPAGLVVTDQMVAEANRQMDGAGVIQPGQSPVYYMYVLLTGYGPAQSDALYGAISDAAGQRPDDANLGQVAAELSKYWGGKTAAQRAQVFEAPRNKIKLLMDIGHYWDGSRPKVSWDEIIQGHRSVIVNTGPYSPEHSLPADVTRDMSALLMYTLKAAIYRNCEGWSRMGRYVTIFVDELALIADENDEVVEWLRDQGRSRGARAVFATQRLGQLKPKVRESFESFGTFAAFVQPGEEAAQRSAAGLTGSGSAQVTVDDVRDLPAFHMLARTECDGARLPAFTGKSVYFMGSPEQLVEYAHRQGYTLPGGGRS